MVISSSIVALPTSLVFLVSNFHSFVPIKLDSNNYILWRNQIRNALTANGYFGYVDGSIKCPSETICDSINQEVPNPECALWKLVDANLLTCITATISVTILPHLLDLHTTNSIWQFLEQRYSSLSRSHIHDLKRKLFNLRKTSAMELYLDSIKECAHKLAAAGSPVAEEDLVFHALNGLPNEYNSFKTATRTRAESLKFEELV